MLPAQDWISWTMTSIWGKKLLYQLGNIFYFDTVKNEIHNFLVNLDIYRNRRGGFVVKNT